MTLALLPFRPTQHFDNAADWLRAFGDIPPKRIIFDPWPGTATEDDLLQFVERDKRLCELIDGTLVEKPMGYWESVIASNLIAFLNSFVHPRNLGVVSGEAGMMRLLPGRVRLPDVAFVSAHRLSQLTDPTAKVPTLCPDLAVEVLSESNTPAEIEQKLREYFQAGAQLAWVIDPKTRTTAVYHHAGQPTQVLDQAGTLDGEGVIPGFTLLVADLFRSIPVRQ